MGIEKKDFMYDLAQKHGLTRRQVYDRLRKNIPLDKPLIPRKELKVAQNGRVFVHKGRIGSAKQRRLREVDYLNGVIVAGKPDYVHKLLARMAG